MNRQSDFERLVAEQLANVGVGSPPSSAIDQTITRASSKRRLPAWLALIKEPPMRTNGHLTVGSPTVRVAAIMAATLFLALTMAAAGVAGSTLLAAEDPIEVAQDGSGDHTTIGAAIAAAGEGHSIVVMPGEYTEALLVDKRLSIRGEGPREEIRIVAPPDSPMIDLTYGVEGDASDPLVEYSVPAGIQLTAPAVKLAGVTVTGPSPGVAIAITAGEAELADLAIAPAGSAAEETGDPALDTRLAVVALGDADLRLRRSEVAAGIEVTDAASALVEQSLFAQGGVGSDGSGSFVVRANVFDEGWVYAGADEALVADNELRNGYIALFGTGHSTVRGNTLDGLRYDVGPGVAITLSEGADAEVVGNTVTNSATGIKTQFYFGTARIEDNELTTNSVGISVGGYDIAVTGNTVTDGDVIGIEVFNAGPTLEGNTITGNTAGLHLGSARDVSLAANTICGNGTNVRVVSGQMPDLTGNDVCPDEPAG